MVICRVPPFLDKAMHFVDSNWVALCVCGGVCAGYFFPPPRSATLACCGRDGVKPQDAGSCPPLLRAEAQGGTRPESRPRRKSSRPGISDGDVISGSNRD